MEAIIKNGSHSLALVHYCPKTSASFIRARCLSFSKNSFPKKMVVVATRATPSISDHEATNRPLFQFPPSLLDDRFLSLSKNDSEMESLGRNIEVLKARVSDKLVCLDAKGKIHLIHMLVSLGVAYHFEKQIEEFLKDAFEKVENITIGEEDIYSISVIFRVFRLYGHKLSSDVFNRFKEENGDFKKCLIDDVRGILSFYEASHFGTNTEEILDEAMQFTHKHLELYVGGGTNADNEAHISELIRNVLYLSQQENAEVIVAREYIRFYEQEPHHDEMLLKFAKLNFKFMQLHYMQELQTVVRWWKELDLESKIPNYYRERVVECLFWATVVYMEPQYSTARIILAKCIVFLTILDDVYDAYCTLPEAIGFTESLERWEADAVDMLPDHLKVFLRSLIDFFQDLEGEVKSEGRLYNVQYAIDEIKRLFRADLALAKWARTGYTPNFDEYMEVGLVTGGVDCTAAVAFIGMGEIAGKEVYDWLRSRPKLIQTLDLKSRFRDDVVTYKDEMARGEIATGINCYMKQYGVTEEEAFLDFDRKVKHASKLMNEEYLKTNMPLKIARVAFNIGRLIDVNYKHGDGFTYMEMLQGQINSLFIDLITI
ncbi:hypothetical protein CARUB_v10012477mg [Capsella rubella]|uniref:(+)-delta-cadinene synthase n=1 Tax=Capsella rubella TaxID=81985 RepID=R0IH63_9BRAS|nr:bifunctional dolabella-3,7-dien-18-ol synthase/dolathalia-3,7,11-triene synthase TPS20, chloroplastic [Capsella rubella]EOA37725.1 hypothetical protein CARUB_v10012477mg [Capsella rubella]